MSVQPASTVVITGSTGGIGLQSALSIARSGARVIITGRDSNRGEAARQVIINETSNPHVEFVKGDVSSIAGVDALAEELLKRVSDSGKIHTLVNNAGYLGNEKKLSDDGVEMHFAVNVLAVWRLTHALLPALRAAGNARVVNVTGGDAPAAVDVENLQAEKGFKGLMTYTHSKSILEAMSLALARDLEPEHIMVNVVFPGRASTAMTQSLTSDGLPGVMKCMMPFFRWFFAEDGGKSAAKAAQSTIFGVTNAKLAGVTGRYFDTNSKEQKMHRSAYDVDRVQAPIMAAIERAVPEHALQ